MSTMSTMQVATNEADLFGDQFDVDKFLMTNEWNNTSDLHQQSSSPPEDNMLTGLLLSDTNSFIDSLLLDTPTGTSGIINGEQINNGLPVDNSPPSSASGVSFDQWVNYPGHTSPSSDDGSSSSPGGGLQPQYNNFSDQYMVQQTSTGQYNGNRGVSPVTPPTAGELSASTDTDVHIDVELDYPDQSSSSERKMGSLRVSPEEMDLLSKEGIVIPVDLPLTKAEEKHVKRIRRKIKNKQSAADSRKRKKEYMDGLEKRVEKCTEMNNSLLKKVKVLETENKSLVEQLKTLQAYVAQYNPSKLQAGSFMMVVILSFSLLIVPQMYRTSNIRVASHARSLLDVSSDEFGNLLQTTKENGYVGVIGDKLTPTLPLPWEYKSPALKPWNSSSDSKTTTTTTDPS